jgi:catechol 2,3-dioxygenase-like lactoylglutathione lyase family enzyme
MKLLGLKTTIYKVSDIEKAKEWYSQVLDFKPYFDQPFYVGLELKFTFSSRLFSYFYNSNFYLCA